MLNIPEISVSKLKQKDLLETMRFGFCVDNQNFVNAFSKIGLKINSEKDLENLAKLHEKKLDIAGFENDNKEVVKLDISEYVQHSISLRHNSFSQCKIKFIA